MTAPTRLQGSAFPELYGSTMPYDLMEHVPDLQPGWASAATYSKMRRDSRLAAILAGYTLQLRRASWQVEPGDCLPEVVQQVADDMGIPVAGNDSAGAGRTQGVSWNDHLRSALLSLTYGHMPFELLAEVNGGRARLVALAERMPQTVQQIHADGKTGALLGITQDQAPKDGLPQIKADRLAFYCHDRELSWYGSSLLRSSYAPWYLKQELLRVHASSARRFGMGVPTVEWSPGVNPTPEQMAQAQKAASAARVGETSGLAMPPGATLVLKGLSGGVVDVLAYIKYLDQAMAGAALMPHMDLGTTESGSRAVASTFLDSWILALGAIGEEIADVATRQIAARIVGWNWKNEPVPRIVVSGVGDQREVTAASLQLLLSSGALAPDPALEAWVRREYRLPERDGMALPAPSVRGDTLAQANRPKPNPAAQLQAELAQKAPANAAPVKASGRRKTPTAGQMALPIAAASRDLTAEEQSSAADFEQIQADHDAAVAALVAALPLLLAPIAAALVASTATALAAGGVAALTGITADAAATARPAGALAEAATALARKAEAQAVAEAAHLGVQITAGGVDAAALRDQASTTAHLIVSGMASAATRAALLHAGPNADPAAVEQAVRAELDALVQVTDRGWITGNASSLMSAAQHAGRMAAFRAIAASGADVAWIASEVNDSANCSECAKWDGHVFSSLDTALKVYPTGRNIACAGRDRCRGMIFAVKP